MGILSRARDRIAGALMQRAPLDGPEQMSFAAELPLTGAQAPLWRVQMHIEREPQAGGEKLRVRAHFQANFASALRPALASDPAATDARALPSDARGLTLAQRTGALVQRAAARALQVPFVALVAEPLLQHDFNSWIEIQATTAPLDRGSRDLLPQSEKLAALGIAPTQRSGDEGPVADSWAGEAPGGFAQVSMLQLDKRHLPPRLAAALGDEPFHLAATIVNTVEQK
ncbi:MAG TPA: hypothetical protein VHE37_10670 [Nevskiaceae bacterium]|nr:hypothetical protein [Nevskiaceae bacterium]